MLIKKILTMTTLHSNKHNQLTDKKWYSKRESQSQS